MLLALRGYAQANGANCYFWVEAPEVYPPSCLNVKAIVFLCFGSSTEKRKEFAEVKVGSLDCHSLLKKHFVFQILE